MSADAAASLRAARSIAEGGPFVALLPDEVAAARRLESLPRPPPLAGTPFAVKDLMAVQGHRIGAGSRVREDAAPEDVDAAIVLRLRGLGAVPVGLTGLHEFAFGGTGVNHHAGTVRHPADPTRIAGGSSAGSAAAVADGTVPFALGTDTGGSVRIPAALCGIVGFKPPYGSYPLDGVLPLAPSLDHVGLLARDLATVARVHRALGHAGAPPVPLRRVGVARGELDAATSDVREYIEAVLDDVRRRGVSVDDVSWPGGDEVFATSTDLMFAEAASVHERDLAERADRYGDDVRERLEQGRAVPATRYLAALRNRDQLRTRTRRVLAGVDVVVGPTVTRVAPTVEEADNAFVRAELVRCTRLQNVTGEPVLSLPVPGPGLPVGLQVTAADDARLLALAPQLLAAPA